MHLSHTGETNILLGEIVAKKTAVLQVLMCFGRFHSHDKTYLLTADRMSVTTAGLSVSERVMLTTLALQSATNFNESKI